MGEQKLQKISSARRRFLIVYYDVLIWLLSHIRFSVCEQCAAVDKRSENLTRQIPATLLLGTVASCYYENNDGRLMFFHWQPCRWRIRRKLCSLTVAKKYIKRSLVHSADNPSSSPLLPHDQCEVGYSYLTPIFHPSPLLFQYSTCPHNISPKVLASLFRLSTSFTASTGLSRLLDRPIVPLVLYMYIVSKSTTSFPLLINF